MNIRTDVFAAGTRSMQASAANARWQVLAGLRPSATNVLRNLVRTRLRKTKAPERPHPIMSGNRPTSVAGSAQSSAAAMHRSLGFEIGLAAS